MWREIAIFWLFSLKLKNSTCCKLFYFTGQPLMYVHGNKYNYEKFNPQNNITAKVVTSDRCVRMLVVT